MFCQNNTDTFHVRELSIHGNNVASSSLGDTMKRKNPTASIISEPALFPFHLKKDC